MNDTPPGGLTPPGPPLEPEPSQPAPPAPPVTGGLSVDDWIAEQAARPPQPAPPNYGAAHGTSYGQYATTTSAAGTDAGLGWTAFGLALVVCIPLLPLVGGVLGVIALARQRFRPRWPAVAAVVIGLLGSAGQVALVTNDDFQDGLRDGVNESLEADTEDARRSGDPTEVNPFKLRRGDCVDDPASVNLEGDEVTVRATVTLLPCKEPHDLEVFKVFQLPEGDFPGQKAIDRATARCFPAFTEFVGVGYAQSELEIYFYFPTKRSWDLIGDRAISCLAGLPDKKVRGSLEDTER
ncbi:septum formation family protein [Nocardioides stalactiti]|uniref:septum formation family protein n=1 Tax=Nocardioides stalactiti TaxID=2755356 RepID=UPI0015FF8A51|nr:septum formation family protein [Nocardioides stalactiti]